MCENYKMLNLILVSKGYAELLVITTIMARVFSVRIVVNTPIVRIMEWIGMSPILVEGEESPVMTC